MASGAQSRKHTAKQNIAADQFDIAGLRGEAKTRRKQGRREVGSIRGAHRFAIQAAQRSSVPASIRGTPEGRQLAGEFRGMEKSLRNSLPFAVAGEQRETKADVSDINADIQAAQFQMGQHEQDLNKAIRDQLAETGENRTEKRAEVDHAYDEARRMIREQELVNKGELEGEKRDSPVPQNEGEWHQFEDALRSVEGVDVRSARKAIKALQRRLEGEVGVRQSSRFKERFPGPTTG